MMNRTGLRNIVGRYIKHKNRTSLSPIHDFRIRIKDSAYSFIPDKTNKTINKEKTEIYEKLTADFIEFAANKKGDINDARKAFSYIQARPRQWKEKVHMMLNAGSHRYAHTGDAELDELNKIIENDIFNDSFEDIKKFSKTPIWKSILYAQSRVMLGRILHPICSFFGKKVKTKYKPKDENITIIGDIHNTMDYPKRVLQYVEQLSKTSTSCDKKIIIAYECDTLGKKYRLGDFAEEFHAKINTLNEARKRKNYPPIELKEIDIEYEDIRNQRAQITQEEKTKLIDDAIKIFQKHKEKIILSQHQSECFITHLTNEYTPTIETVAEEIYNVFAKSFANNESFLSEKDKDIIYKLRAFLSPDASLQFSLLYEAKYDDIASLSEKNENSIEVKNMIDNFIKDPLFKRYLHYTHDNEEKKDTLKTLFDQKSSVKEKMSAIRTLIGSPFPQASSFISYLRSHLMLDQVREMRSEAIEKTKTLDQESEEYKKALEDKNAHIVMFMGQSHVDDLRPVVDGAKIMDAEGVVA